MRSMKISIKLPVMVRVDSVTMISMAGDITTTSHAKYVNIRYKYMNEYAKEGIAKIIFVKFAENDSDILSKNLTAELHQKHSKKIIGKKTK